LLSRFHCCFCCIVCIDFTCHLKSRWNGKRKCGSPSVTPRFFSHNIASCAFYSSISPATRLIGAALKQIGEEPEGRRAKPSTCPTNFVVLIDHILGKTIREPQRPFLIQLKERLKTCPVTFLIHRVGARWVPDELVRGVLKYQIGISHGRHIHVDCENRRSCGGVFMTGWCQATAVTSPPSRYK
jgi:hypothetical protein